MTKIWQPLLLAMLSGFMWCSTANAQASAPSLIIAITPQFAPTQTHRNWTPLLERLGQMTGYRFQLRVYDQIPAFEAELAQGIPDLAFMNPYHMVMAKKANGYRPLVRDSTTLVGVLVVRSDGPIKNLADLNGQVLAFPSPNALGASLFMRALLMEKEGLKFTPTYVGNHQTVYRQVLQGDAAAGGGVRATHEKEPPAVQAQLKVLYATPEVAPHPLAAHPRVSAVVSRKIVDALLALRSDAEGSKLLTPTLMPQPQEADYQRDYEPLSRLRLERYVDGAAK